MAKQTGAKSATKIAERRQRAAAAKPTATPTRKRGTVERLGDTPAKPPRKPRTTAKPEPTATAKRTERKRTTRTAAAAKPTTTAKRTERKRTERQSTPAAKPESTERVGRVESAQHDRAAKMATALMRATMIVDGRPAKRGPITTPQMAALDAFVTGSVADALDVRIGTLAQYALGAENADAAAAVRTFGRKLVHGGKLDSEGKPLARHGLGRRVDNKSAGLSKLGGRKLALALVALAVERGYKPTGATAKRVTAARKLADAAIAGGAAIK